MAIRVFITGGTFDKTYDEISGRLLTPPSTRWVAANGCWSKFGLYDAIVSTMMAAN